MTVRGQRFCLYDAGQLEAVLDAMAHQTVRFVQPGRKVVLVGLLRRGEPLARALQGRLARLTGATFEYYGLTLKRYADDLTLIHPETRLTENPQLASADFSSATVIVVDDVLYRGYSLLRAVDYLAQLGAGEIRTVVLVDRGAEKLPVRADVAGVRLDVAPGDVVECHVPPYEADLRIELLRPARG
ncbi:MAG: phosphoribosyltransferase [Betaproteobacteria bacterium]|nr:phosphoribosyltransferase [Betaproteobacteria bacterium]